jgi:hypothetical protein
LRLDVSVATAVPLAGLSGKLTVAVVRTGAAVLAAIADAVVIACRRGAGGVGVAVGIVAVHQFVAVVVEAV